jgi:hypothetical protein
MTHPITLTIHVDAAAAVRAGRSQAGPCTVRLTDDDLAGLSPERRVALERHLAGENDPTSNGPQWGDPLSMHAPPIGKVERHTWIDLLDTRIAVMQWADAKACELVHRSNANRNKIAKAIESIDPSWAPVYRDDLLDDDVRNDLLTRYVLAAIDQIAPRYVIGNDDYLARARTTNLDRDQHARLQRIVRALPVGWTWSPWHERVPGFDPVGTWLEVRGAFADVDLIACYDLDHDMPPRTAVDDETEAGVQLQRLISASLRGATGVDGFAQAIREAARTDSWEQRPDLLVMLGALSAACRDPIIRPALANVMTEMRCAAEINREEGAT